MNQQQPELLEEVPLPEGTVSAQCRVVETEGLHRYPSPMLANRLYSGR